MLAAIKSLFRQPRPAGPARILKRFESSDPTVTQSPLQVDGEALSARVSDSRTLRLFEFRLPALEPGKLTYRAQLKSQDLDGRAYLELWCRFPGRGEFFSKGLHDPITGSNDWASAEVPFFLKPDEVPDLVKINLAVEGRGQVWIKDIELEHTPLDW